MRVTLEYSRGASPSQALGLTAVFELSRITDCRDHSRRHQRTDALEFDQPSAPFVLLAEPLDAPVVLTHTIPISHCELPAASCAFCAASSAASLAACACVTA